MSPMWDDIPERAPGHCAGCGAWTADGLVRWVTRSPGPDMRIVVHSEPDACTPQPTHQAKEGP
ncbi:hypothetical protein PV350_35330 [Streptomyces sp. PA03-6a]|nr:hypothetical protein [Streptomyces sp. PA03-6a]